MENMHDFFGPAVSVYTRAQAIEDGVLVDVTDTAREAGFTVPVAMTDTVWADAVEWTAGDAAGPAGGGQSTTGRLWDVVYLAAVAARGNKGRSDAEFEVRRVARGGTGRPTPCFLRLRIGPGDAGEPVATIMMLHED